MSYTKGLDILSRENEELKTEVAALKAIIDKIQSEKTKSWSEIVDEKVDNWFEKFRDEVDIGRVTTFEFLGKKYEIDVLPDNMEKAIYKKCIKIIMAMAIELKDNL